MKNIYIYIYIYIYIFLLCVLKIKYKITLNRNAFLTQAIASFFAALIEFGFPSLYATLVCVACSQLEKLRAALLDIRQSHVITDPYSGEDNYQRHREWQNDTSEEVFQNIRQQLNDCIRHHQNIQRYDHV
jgi:hypothetical protein